MFDDIPRLVRVRLVLRPVSPLSAERLTVTSTRLPNTERHTVSFYYRAIAETTIVEFLKRTVSFRSLVFIV